MEAVAKLSKLARQHARGVITLKEFEMEALEVLVEDRAEIIEAVRNGTLVTVMPDGTEVIG